MSSGSLFVVLKDLVTSYAPLAENAAEYAKAGKSILEFGTVIAGAFKKRKEVIPVIVDKAAYRTVDKAIKLAARGGGTLQFKQEDANGKRTEIYFSKPEILQAQTPQNLTVISPPQPQFDGKPIQSLPSYGPTRFSAPETSTMYLSDRDIDDMVKSSTHFTGGYHLLHGMIDNLDAAGRKDLAERIRQRMRLQSRF